MIDDRDKTIATISSLLTDLFEIEAVYQQDHSFVFSLLFRADRKKSTVLIKERLSLAGYTVTAEETGENLVLSIDPRPRLKIPRLNIVLFVLTLMSVYFVPVFLKNYQITLIDAAQALINPPVGWIAELWFFVGLFPESVGNTLSDMATGTGLEFTLALISILFVHEMGHFIASRRRNIITSWPYFIPAPNLIGTFGAVIKSKSPFWNRRDLIEVGAAGPIAGWIVAVGWLIFGLSQSYAQPAEAFGYGELAFSMEGESILMKVCANLFLPPIQSGYFYKLSEAAFAGWVGLLVTAINMLPIGQLDGGHVMYALLPRRQRNMGVAALIMLIFLGFQSPMWWFFAAFGLIFGVGHPPTMNDTKKPGPTAVALGIISLVILLLSFTPVPFR